MHQENFRKKIVKYTIVLTLISAVIIASSVIVVVAVRTAEERSYTAYVDSLVSEYRLRFEEQMASDLETLHLLEALMEKGLLSEETIVSDQVRNLSDSFSFVKVGYYDIHAEEYEVHLPDSDRAYEFANRPAEAGRQYGAPGRVRRRFLRSMKRMGSRRSLTRFQSMRMVGSAEL